MILSAAHQDARALRKLEPTMMVPPPTVNEPVPPAAPEEPPTAISLAEREPELMV